MNYRHVSWAFLVGILVAATTAETYKRINPVEANEILCIAPDGSTYRDTFEGTPTIADGHASWVNKGHPSIVVTAFKCLAKVTIPK